MNTRYRRSGGRRKAMRTGIAGTAPESTIDWLLGEDNPAVAVLTRRRILNEADDDARALWRRRNEYAPVASILDLELPDGSWAPPPRDYQKYWGSLWQIHFLGELWADGADQRVQRAATYAFSRQREDGMWSCSNMQAHGAIPCLTANVGRALARLGYATDERVVAALASCVARYRELGVLGCSRQMIDYQLNGYCHMLTPKLLLFLGEVPREAWPDGAEELRDACVAALREKEVFRCLPAEAKEFQQMALKLRGDELHQAKQHFLAEHEPLSYGDKPGWLRFGFPLSYNSDALEALAALAAVGEARRPEYEAALALVEVSADKEMRWKLRTSFNGKMLADVEAKGQPSKWVTLRAWTVLDHFAVMLS
jgi:hypothetical protein